MKRFMLRPLVVIIAIVIALVISEIVVRAHDRAHDWKIVDEDKLLWSGAYASIAELNAVWRHKKQEYDITYRSNSEGFRDRDSVPGEVLDIAFVGDSFAWGSGIDLEDRISDIVRANPDCRVLNFGLCTAGTINELAIYRDFVEPKQPKLVVLLFFANDVQNDMWRLGRLGQEGAGDIRRIYAVMEARSRVPLSYPSRNNLILPKLEGLALPDFLRRKAESRKSKKAPRKTQSVTLPHGREVEIGIDILSGDSHLSPALKYYSRNQQLGWQLTGTALAEMNRRISAIGSKLVVAYIPCQGYIEPGQWAIRKPQYKWVVPDDLLDWDKPRVILKDMVQEMGADFIDLSPALLEARKDDEPLYWLADSHLTPRASPHCRPCHERLLEAELRRPF